MDLSGSAPPRLKVTHDPGDTVGEQFPITPFFTRNLGDSHSPVLNQRFGRFAAVWPE